MANLGEVRQQLFGIAGGAVGLVSDHVGKVLNAVHILRGLVQLVANLILQFLRQPDQTGNAALGLQELVGCTTI